MAANGKKFEGFQEELETKKLKIQLLESEIANISVEGQKKDKFHKEITEERARMGQQTEIMRKLYESLQLQLSNMQESNKENTSTQN